MQLKKRHPRSQSGELAQMDKAFLDIRELLIGTEIIEVKPDSFITVLRKPDADQFFTVYANTIDFNVFDMPIVERNDC